MKCKVHTNSKKLLVYAEGGKMAGPTLDDITDSVCAGGTFHKCLPYGMCYNFQSYCSDRSRTVNSCFPYDIAGDIGSLLDWCQKQTSNNFTSLIHPSCKYACMDKFNASALYQCLPCNNVSSSDYMWFNPVVWVLSILLLVSTVVIIVLSVLLCKSCKGRHPTEVSDEESGDSNNMLKGNDKSAENDEEHAADARENDVNINRPALNDRNLPARIHTDPAHSSSPHTQNGTPMNQYDHDQVGSQDTLNVIPRNQRDPVQGSNTQDVIPRNQRDPVQGSNTQNVIPRNQRDPVQGSNTQNGAPSNQLEQDHDRNINTQNGTRRSQYEHDHGINTQSRTPEIQHDLVQGRITQNGDLINESNPDQCRNTQGRTSVSQHEALQGRTSVSQHEAVQGRTSVSQHEALQGRSAKNVTQINQLDRDQSTINTQDGQARYYPEPRASVTSPSSVSFRPALGGTSEERSALLPESDDSLSRGQTQRDWSANFSPEIPEAEGKHKVVTSLSKLE